MITCIFYVRAFLFSFFGTWVLYCAVGGQAWFSSGSTKRQTRYPSPQGWCKLFLLYLLNQILWLSAVLSVDWPLLHACGEFCITLLRDKQGLADVFPFLWWGSFFLSSMTVAVQIWVLDYVFTVCELFSFTLAALFCCSCEHRQLPYKFFRLWRLSNPWRIMVLHV